MTPPDLVIPQRGEPGREIVYAGREPIAERVFMRQSPRLNPQPIKVRQNVTAPFALSKVSAK